MTCCDGPRSLGKRRRTSSYKLTAEKKSVTTKASAYDKMTGNMTPAPAPAEYKPSRAAAVRVYKADGHGNGQVLRRTYRMQDAGCRMQDAGCRMQDAGCTVHEPRTDLLRAVVPLAPSSSGGGDTLGREAPWGADVGRPWVPLNSTESHQAQCYSLPVLPAVPSDVAVVITVGARRTRECTATVETGHQAHETKTTGQQDI